MFSASGNYELQVCPNGRACADEYSHQGSTWIEGREGSKYVLRFINRTNARVEVIFSVDGLDTIKGQPAGPNSGGYLVNANDSLEVPGWMLDDKTAAEFYFARVGKSYAAASGSNTSNTGVIGAMVFTERVWQPYPFTLGSIAATPASIQSWGYAGNSLGSIGGSTGMASPPVTPRRIMSSGMSSASAAPAAISASINHVNMVGSNAIQPTTTQDVGTGFGDATQFNTVMTSFTRSHQTIPDDILAVYYNTARNLQKMGIVLRTKSTRYDNSTAKAFPAYNQGCTPPPGWKP